MADGGHSFVKKTFHKPTYCHHCSDLLWGLIQQGYICEVCNFIIHERCVSSVVTPCSGIAPCIIKNPVAHCWSEPTHHKRKFCTVCRKRLDETPAVHCLVCEYFAHIECQDFAVPDCTENATYVPGKELLNVKHQHHWREGNLPSTSKCAYCKKTCWSSECLTGYRCEWCGMTTHAGCRMYLPTECNFGILQPIYLPPHSVSIPRTEVPIEAIIGVQVKSKTSLVRDYSCPSPDLSCPIPGAGSGSLTSLGLKELLELHRQRLEQSKQHFLLSTPPTPTSCGSISLCHSPTPSSLTVGETSNEAEQDRERDQDQPEEEPEEENTEQDSALQLTTSTSNVIGNLQKSPSANSSLHLLYTNLFRKLGQGKRRRKRGISSGGLSPSEDEDDVDGGVCDISGGDLSDDYDHCDVALRRRSLRSRQPRDVSETDYHGDAEAEAEGETVPRESCYETSDTGGELTNTDDLDSSLNLISNLSYNSSNNSNASNVPGGATAPAARNIATTSTTAPGKSGHALSVQGGRQQPKTGALAQIKPKPKPILMPKHKAQGKGGSLSSPLSNSNSSDCSSASPSAPATLLQLSPVGRSKSFQESAAITAVSRYKKYGRGLFQRRRSKRSPKNAVGVGGKSNYSLDRLSQNIEITIQDEDGNFHPYDDNYHMLAGRLDATDVDDDVGFDDLYLDDRPSGASDDVAFAGDISDGGASSRSRASDASDGHVLGRLLRQVRQGLSVGWRKPRYQKRRARSISEEFSSGDTPRFKDEESASKAESGHGPSSGGAGGGGGSGGAGGSSAAGASASAAGGSSGHYRPDSGSGHKSDKSEKDREKKEKEREEKDIEMIKVFDGNNSFRRQQYRVIIVQRTYTLEQLLTTALRAFHITRDPQAFYLTDLYAPAGMEDTPMLDPTPVLNLVHLEGKRPAIYLRFHDRDRGHVRVYPGKLQCSMLEDPYVSVPVDNSTVIKDLIRDALDKFGLQDNQIQDYRCSEVLLDRGVTERILSWNERPWDIMKQLGKDSIRQMELMRFYMQHKQDPHGPNIALFVGNLPTGLSQRNYEQILNKYVTDENKFISIGPIYYEYGSVVLTFEDSMKAVRAFYNLRETIIEDKKLLVLLLPNIEPSMVPSDVRPLLVFVNVKSGGCQGLELISSFRKLLNPYQVFDLDNGGPLPGLYVFRQITNYKILVCGGDGTIGWVLQCLDNVGQDSECSSPPCAIVPLGTGNDLARVLCWGSGYTGGEDPLNLLRDVIEAEEIRLDRWTVVFHPEDKPEEPAMKAPSQTTGKKKKAHQAHLSQSQQTNQHHQLPALTSSDISGGAQNEDNSQIFVMNNYFGIGIDADLCLDFHNAREENPNQFNSRLRNKGYYVKMGLRKIVGRKAVKDLQKELRLEVDGKIVELPPVDGIIILNILSWGSGANPWGPDKDDQFSTPNHYDGMLEVVGVTGVVHLGQIQSGIRTAMRIAQGGHIKIHLNTDMPVQVDGEPWIQSPGDVVVLKSALKATMLKKTKSKRRLTEPHISPAVLSLSVAQQGSGSGSGSVSVSGSPQSQSQQQLQQQQQQQQQLAENGEKEASMTLPAGFGST
ncbi:diacylglycerol kinase theta isoform X1 [Drosophila mauritiana]|uniref:Diacylglycerol kinase n=1 Tax=Drosophila mauritiana TaxID=7226 RepID=A0A6P8KHW2_DROMA|nr:diacylglycerol kinase theta isoform X1 [Drosophila mauritiana]